MNIHTKKNYGRSYWGPRLWYIIHKISYNLPITINIEEQQLLMKYFSTIGLIIPCPYCAAHFSNSMSIKLLNQNLSTRQSVINWFKNQHNDVNLMNRGRVYQDFEIDLLYQNTPFNHDYFIELLHYFSNRIVSGKITAKVFIHWILMTFKLHPCDKCKMLAINYFLRNDIENLTNIDNSVVKRWIDGLISNIKHT